MATVDPAFEGAGQKLGLEIWRIEKMQVVKQDPKNNGQFYSGDSYIVLHTAQKKGFSSYSWDIHFWLGKETSQDESGVAAYKTVELDDSLGGAPVQHREVQEHESKLFLSYFKKGIRYLKGGVASGFRKVEDEEFDPILLHVKGKRNVRVRQVETRVTSLNKGDVFILDCGKTLYVWIGPDSNRMERIKGIEVAKQIRDDMRSGKAIINIIDKKWETDDKFFEALGGKGKIREAEVAGSDSEHEKKAQAVIKLYKVSDDSGDLKVTEIVQRPLTKDLLQSQDCYILDGGSSGIYAWIGSECSREEKHGAMKHAIEFLEVKGYPSWTQVTQVIDKGEPAIFKQYFSIWPEDNALTPDDEISTSNIAKVEQTKFDAKSLHEQKRKKQKANNVVDDGSGTVQVWRIEDFEMKPVDPKIYGMFFGGDSYVILYTYEQHGRENHIIYFWQGLKSSQDEKGASALLAAELDNKKLNGRAVQVRVVQNKEPEHFMRIFQGKMIVFMGGHASGFKNMHDHDTYDDDGTRMYHIRGTNEFNTRAIQVPEKASSLNSNDVFVLETPGNIYVWRGKGSSKEERYMARNVAGLVSTPDTDKPVMIDEEEEPPEFWADIGGKADYASSPVLETPTVPPRLFHCSNATGTFTVEEIVDFDQEDLNEEDVMILDTYDEVFVWIGEGANATEKKEVLHTAMEYVRTDPSPRTEDTTTIVQVKQGYEPPNFTGCFHAWDPEKWSHGKSYDELLAEIGDENVGVTCVLEELSKYNMTYSLEELQRIPPPEGVDQTHKEKHLSDADFQEVFGMTKEDFVNLPNWKQLEKKKAVKLF